jgi:hypothetical protein
VDGRDHALASLTPGMTPYPFCRKLGGTQWQSGLVRRTWPPPPGFDTRTGQIVANRYTDCVIPNALRFNNRVQTDCSGFELPSHEHEVLVTYNKHVVITKIRLT